MIEFKPNSVTIAREAAGLTQDELAEKAGITRQTLIKAEYGKSVNISTLLKIANALDIENASDFFSNRRNPILFRRFSHVMEINPSCQ